MSVISQGLFLSFATLTFALGAWAQGLDKAISKKSDQIASFSRPCCSFGQDISGKILGLSKVIGPESLGAHHYARLNKQNDNVGITYTCRAGFIDVSHLRDNADWSAHIRTNILNWLGKGIEVDARNEGGTKRRYVSFPVVSSEDLASLTPLDLDHLSVAIAFKFALMHEIVSSFKIAVSAPATLVVNERGSAFSLEDAYSNLQGNWLGVAALRSGRPYNEEMTRLLSERLELLEAQSEVITQQAFNHVRNDWWVKSFKNSFKHVRKRDFSYQGEVRPLRIKDFPYCQNRPLEKLPIPETLSNGKSVSDYFKVRAVPSKKLIKSLQKLDVSLKGELSQDDYPRIIETIKKNFLHKLGPQMLSE